MDHRGRGHGAPPLGAVPPSRRSPVGLSWSVERVVGSAAEVHGRALPDPITRTVRIVEATGPALVLGSTQPEVPYRGVDVVRRRSGGGAVLVRPGEVVWVDVVLPAGDPLWEEDVGRAFHWLGRAWVEALGAMGVEGEWHHGPIVCTPLCRQVCFAGVGPGEVTVDGRKVVGLAQRRTRAGALFQCAALLHWDPHDIVELLGLGADAETELGAIAAALPASGDVVESALLDVFRANTGA